MCAWTGVLRRATMKCSLQIEVDVVDVVDVRLDGCTAKGNNEVLAVD
jgi:hypothetical protein